MESIQSGSSLEGYLQPGDRLYEIDGERVYVANDFTTLLSLDLAHNGDLHEVVVIRDGKKVTFPELQVEARQLPSPTGVSLRYGLNLVAEPRNLGNVLSFSCLLYTSVIIPLTSSWERFQFSVEKAYTVRYRTPRVRQ